MIAQVDLHYIKLRPMKLLSRLISYSLFEGRPVTTRGQWINSLVFFNFAIAKQLPQLKKVKKPLFILGMGRSGTTILGIILSMHRDVGFLNEPKALWHAIYPNEDVIGSYSRLEAHYHLDSGHASEKVVRSAHRLFGAYLATVFSKRLVDKYPELIFRIPFVLKLFPDAQFIFLVRNGWDTCASVAQWSKRRGKQKNGEVHDWWGVNQRKWKLMLRELVEPDYVYSGIKDVAACFERHTDMAALEWVVTMREGIRCMQKHSECIRMVRYEDLVKTPRKILREIAIFAGFSEDETYLQYGELRLRDSPIHPKFDMHVALRPLFDETMCALGYHNDK